MAARRGPELSHLILTPDPPPGCPSPHTGPHPDPWTPISPPDPQPTPLTVQLLTLPAEFGSLVACPVGPLDAPSGIDLLGFVAPSVSPSGAVAP